MLICRPKHAGTSISAQSLRLATLVTLTLAAASSHSATWYVMVDALSSKGAVYFDRETVSRNKGVVTLWLKHSVDPEDEAIERLSAQLAKSRYDCSNRTWQIISATSYDKQGNPFGTVAEPSQIMQVMPGTTGERILKTVCSKGFPNKKSGMYEEVPGNDTDRYARFFFELMRAKKDHERQ